MGIIGFKCPIERTDVPFNHFDSCTANRGRPAYPPWLAAVVARKAQEDVRHAKLDLTATRCTNCPRQTYIETQFNYYVDPVRRAAMDRGTVMHEAAIPYFDDNWWITEVNDPVRTTLEGILFGVRITMKADVIRRDLKEIVDLKFPKDWSVAMRSKDGGTARPEYAIQLNIARLLLAQQSWAIAVGYDPSAVLLTIWDHGLGKSEGPEPMNAPHMTEEQMLAVMPWGGATTVREIIETHLWMIEEHARTGADVAGVGSAQREGVAARLPLYGETMMRGDKCMKYCDVAPLCNGLVRKYGRPEDIAATDEAPADDSLGDPPLDEEE